MKRYWVLRVSALLLAVLCFCSTASAWQEIAVRGHHARIIVEKDGSAEIRHELMLKIRGGPVTEILVPGVGEVSRFLSDAQVSRARIGSSGIWPLELSLDDEGSLHLNILGERGLRGGSYRFQFSYIVDLKKRGWLKPQKQGALLTWVAPRFPSGIYSAKATFSLPHSRQAPTLEKYDDGRFAGVLLSELRRGSDRDELELVRAYVAAEEPALFQIRAPEELFTPPKSTARASESLPKLANVQLPEPQNKGRWVLSLLLSVALAGLVWRKAKEVSRAAENAQSRERPLIPVPALLRALLIAICAFVSCLYFYDYQPERAVLFAIPILLLSSFLLATRVQKARGPGTWRPVIDANESEKSEKNLKFQGQKSFQFFDHTKPLGAFILLLLVTASAVSSWLLLHKSHYFSLGSVGALVLVLPLFLTGQSSKLPQSPLKQAKPYFLNLRDKLDALPVSFELWGRQCLAIAGEESRWVEEGQFDEMRVRLILDSAAQGLRAFEVSLDEMSGDWLRPCVVLKVLDESDALRQLPNSIVWRRGLKPDEKVALVALSSSSESELTSLLRGLVKSLKRQQSPQAVRRDVKSASL